MIIAVQDPDRDKTAKPLLLETILFVRRPVGALAPRERCSCRRHARLSLAGPRGRTKPGLSIVSTLETGTSGSGRCCAATAYHLGLVRRLVPSIWMTVEGPHQKLRGVGARSPRPTFTTVPIPRPTQDGDVACFGARSNRTESVLFLNRPPVLCALLSGPGPATKRPEWAPRGRP
jgi:hypothetical protein